MNQIIPIPKCSVTVRPATLEDLPFMDSLQKLHTKQVGWMPTAQFEGKIRAGHVLIAEQTEGADRLRLRSGLGLGLGEDSSEARLNHHRNPNPNPNPLPLSVGYVIGNDQYFKRDDVGIIYQMNVLPDRQRGFIGAALLKAMFDRAAYGCKLFCCWCAQDIQANYFWESLGFVPLAFRAGSRGKGRVHIFWQRRIRAGDTTTPYWFPSQTSSGSIREDRLVLPIPPGTHWSDAKPMILPSAEQLPVASGPLDFDRDRQLPAPCENQRKARRGKSALATNNLQLATISAGGLRFASTKPVESKEKPKREPKMKVKNDPRHVAAARELRDRWLEEVNSGRYLPEAEGKYEVSRTLPSALRLRLEESAVEGSRALEVLSADTKRMPLLEAA